MRITDKLIVYVLFTTQEKFSDVQFVFVKKNFSHEIIWEIHNLCTTDCSSLHRVYPLGKVQVFIIFSKINVLLKKHQHVFWVINS